MDDKKILRYSIQLSMLKQLFSKELISVYENPMSVEINRLKSEGKSVKEIQDITGLSPGASVVICLIRKPSTIWNSNRNLQNV